MIFEYTAPRTPQQNGVVEREFVMVMGQAIAMMNHAGFTMAKKQCLWSEAAQTATLLDNNIMVQDSAKSPPFTQFWCDTILTVVSLFSLRSSNSTTLTSQ